MVATKPNKFGHLDFEPTSVATINSTGLATGVSAGSTTIRQP